jgi:hypothetical protein
MIYPSTTIITILLAFLTFTIPKKYFVVPLIVCATFLPAEQRIIILDLDFTPLRILVTVGVLRLWLRGEIITLKWTRVDKLILLWAGVGAIIYIIQWMDLSALIFKCGILFDVIGFYWLFRQNIREWADIIFVFKILAVCSLVLAPFVGYEWSTGSNPFALLGKVGTEIREGRYRCQATFSHSILLGSFFATLAPIFIGLGKVKGCKYLSWAAATTCAFIVFASASSTPIFTLIGTLTIVALFRFRCYNRQVVLSICMLLIALWYRYHLVNSAIKNFNEWFLIGCRETGHWGYGTQDLTNQYILEGVQGGLITLTLLIILLVYAIKIPVTYSLSRIPVSQQWLSWGICVSILGHCISFFGVSYFGQIRMFLYLAFAIVAVISEIGNPKPQLLPNKLGIINS